MRNSWVAALLFSLLTGNSILQSDPVVVNERHGQFAPKIVDGGDLEGLLWLPDKVSVGEPGVDLRDGQQKAEDTDGPEMSGPGFFN